MKRSRVVIVTGLSGSGKSTALRALEDIGFFCVDNLPVVLLPDFLEIQTDEEKDITQVALVMDLRETGFLERYPEIFDLLKEKGYRIEVLFLDAGDEALLHRFSETRRVHPLALKGSVMEGIQEERRKMASLKDMADTVIDSTFLNVHQLKDAVQRAYLPPTTTRRIILHVQSFGYRYGLPADADIVMDVRFLQNPYFVETLKRLDGHDPAVRQYVLSSEEGSAFLDRLLPLLTFLLPLYEKEGKPRINIAMGCTGGRHRSVVMANELACHFSDQGYLVSTTHRDINKSG